MSQHPSRLLLQHILQNWVCVSHIISEQTTSPRSAAGEHCLIVGSTCALLIEHTVGSLPNCLRPSSFICTRRRLHSKFFISQWTAIARSWGINYAPERVICIAGLRCTFLLPRDKANRMCTHLCCWARGRDFNASCSYCFVMEAKIENARLSDVKSRTLNIGDPEGVIKGTLQHFINFFKILNACRI